MFLVYHGLDEFAAHEALDALRATGGFEHNQETFAGAETDLATIRNTCNTLPFLSARRLVVVRGLPKPKRRAGDEDDDDVGDADDADDTRGEDAGAPEAVPRVAPTRGRGKKQAGATQSPKAFIQGLADLAAELPESTVLVVMADEDLRAGSPLLEAAKKHGKAHAFPELHGARLEAWLEARARAREVTLAPEAARLLIEVAGETTRVLASEIEKLSTYAGPGGRIGIEEVHLLTPAVRELRAFDLTDALLRRERTRALTILHELLAKGEPPLKIVGMIAYQTRQLMQVRALSERGMRPPQIAQTAGMHPFVAEKSFALARQYNRAHLERAHRMLYEVDLALKRSRMTPEMALDLFVVEFGRSA